MSTEEKLEKPSERDSLDLLELVCELHSRALAYPSKDMHDAYVAARNEMEKRIKQWEELLTAAKELPSDKAIREKANYLFADNSNVEAGYQLGMTEMRTEAQKVFAVKEREKEGWHKVVVECERILECKDTAENPTMSNLPNLVRGQKVAIAELREEIERLMCNNSPWPLKNIVEKLVEAADILLHEKNYDADGYEQIGIALGCARGWMKLNSKRTGQGNG